MGRFPSPRHSRAHARTPRRGSARWLAAVLTVIGLVVAPLAVVGTVLLSTASPAEAAEVTIGAVRARLADHDPTSAGGSTNCIRYAPSSGTGSSTTSSAWVGSTGEALTAHGYTTPNQCTSNLDLKTKQSALGFTPTSSTTVQTGSTFLLGRFAHYNNPVTVASANYTGNLVVQLSNTDITFPWTMWETPNAAPCASGVPSTAAGCDDRTAFTNQISAQTITVGGISYRLVVVGFTDNGSTQTCSTSPNGTYVNEFWTHESATTYGCLYATMSQIRTLTVVKDANAPVSAPASVPTFNFSTTSNLAGSPWQGRTFGLTPTIATNASSTYTGTAAQVLAGSEQVTISEVAPPTNWAATALECRDGAGALLANTTYNVASRTITISNVPEATTSAAVPITCTFANVYTPRSTLTLVKSVTGGGPAAAGDWTLTATRTGTPPGQISGTGGSSAIVNQSVVSGTWSLAESATGANAAGYVQDSAWACTNVATGATVPVTNSAVALADGANVRCTVINRYRTGTFEISKAVTGETAGFTGTATTPFTGTYTCSNNASGTFSVSTGARWTSPQLPVGVTCTVTETQPTGNLANGSYTWGTPGIGYPGGAANVGIVDGSGPVVAITNPISRLTGTLQISKVVAPSGQATAAGYTGGTTRTFPVTYTCRLGGSVVATGTVAVSTAGATSVPNVPATASCTFSETLTAQAGDFADASYSWVEPGVFSPSTVNVLANATGSTTVTNTFTRTIVQLTIAKVVEGAGYTGTGTPFAIRYDCGAPYAGTVNLGPGGSQAVAVPAGVQCTVVESAPSAGLLDVAHVWGAARYTGLSASGTVTVPAGGSGSVTVTNPTISIFGTVSVTKQVAGAVAGLPATTRFPITVTCSNGYSSGVQQIAPGATFTTPALPVGTTCAADEGSLTGIALVDDSYTWGTVDEGVTATVARDTSAPITVTNEIVRRYGAFAVTKTVAGVDGLTGAAVTFSGTWSCTYGSGTGAVTVGGTWSVTGSGSAALTGPAGQVLLGSTCSATEDQRSGPPSTTDTSYHWGAEQIGPAITLTAAAPNGSVGVTNPITRVTGSFGISKSVIGDTEQAPGYDPSASFAFTYRCQPETGAAITGTLDVLPNGQLVSAASVPAGSACTVTEASVTTPIDPYRWSDVQITVTGATGTQSGSTVTFTTPADGAAVGVAVVNVLEARSAAVTVTKEVTGEVGGFTAGSDPVFPITLACDDVTYGPELAADGGAVVFGGIPLGASCEASEGTVTGNLVDGSYAWATPTIGDAVIVEDAGATIAVTNPIVRVYGPVALIKVVDLSGYAGVVPADLGYSGSWTCTYPGAADVTGTWSVSGAGRATLTGGGSDGTLLLIGSECSATENALGPPSADPSYRWADETITPAVVAADGSGTVTVTNTLLRDTADLVVSKVLTGETDGYVDGTFPIGYTCSAPGVAGVLQGSVDVALGQDPAPLATGIPRGWTCTISEGSLSGVELVDTSYAWSEPQITIDGEVTSTVTLSEAGAEVGVVVTNTLERVLGTVEVVKELAATTPVDVVEDGATFSGGYECVYGEGTAAEARHTGTWTVTGTGVATLEGETEIPLTSVCSVTEASPSDADLVDDSWTWTEPVLGDDATVTAAGQPARLTVTNGVERVYGGLTVVKEYEGDTAAFDDALRVTGAWVCYVAGVPVPGASGTWSLPATGGTADVVTAQDAVVPATASCVVTEDTLDDGDLADASWTWLDPTFEPAGSTALEGAVAIDGNAQVQVTVTNDTERVYADLEVTKTVTGDALTATGYDPTTTFSGTYSCTYGSDEPVTGTWGPITAGQTATLGGTAYVGSVCTITDESLSGPPVPIDSSYVWLPRVLEPASVTLVAGATNTLGVVNPTQRVLGSFAVVKAQISGASDAAPGAGYDFTYTCTAPNGDVVTDQLNDLEAGGAAVVVGGVPVRSTCVVVEEDLPVVEGPFRWGEPVFAVSGVGENGTTPVTGGVQFVLPRVPVEPVVVTATNTLLPAAEIDKDFVGATQHLVDGTWDGSWDLAYTIEVSNPSTATGLDYSLTDTVDYDGATVVAGSATSAATGTVAWTDLTAPFAIVPVDAPLTLPAAGTHRYDAVVTVRVDPSGAASIEECEAGEGGLANSAEAVTGPVSATDGACAEIPGDPAVSVTKTLVGTPVQGDDGRWTLTYDVVVSNDDETLATRYDLADTLRYGGGIVVESASVSGPGASESWDGVTDPVVATAQTLAASTDATYRVVVVATVGADATATGRDCILAEGESGTGFLNQATVSTAAGQESSQACGAPVSPLIEKTFVEGSGVPVTTPGQVWDGAWALDYQITVTNPDAVTGLVYSLTDELTASMGDVVSVEVSGGQLGEPLTWDGPAGEIVSTEAPAHLAAGSSDVYLVHVVVRTEGGAEPVACGDGADGIVNTAAATSGSDTLLATACGDLPGLPGLVLVKEAIDAAGVDVTSTLGANWQLTATSVDGLVDPVTGAGLASAAVLPGEYRLSEAAIDGFDDAQWAGGDWECVDPQGQQVPVTDGVVTIVLGVDVVCGITNTEAEVPPTPTPTPTPSPSGSAAPTPPRMPASGAAVGGLLVAAGTLLLAGLATLLVVRRRRVS